jgi:hypothetical protein
VWRGTGGAGAGTGFEFEFPLPLAGVALFGVEFTPAFASTFAPLGAAGDPGVDERVWPGRASAAWTAKAATSPAPMPAAHFVARDTFRRPTSRSSDRFTLHEARERS